MSQNVVSICEWPDDRPFAYSMTYDEGTVDTLANALPVHEQFGFPGHVDVVAGQLGRRRDAYLSSLNNYVHMSADELKFLISQGWGVGNHSWSHYVYPAQPGLDLWREVVWSKYRLEDMIEHPVRIFTIPNNRFTYPPILDLARQHYLAICYLEGAPNRDDVDLYRIGNFMVASGKIREGYDWKKQLLTENLSREFLDGAWQYETTHLCMWNVPQAHKCITPADLTQRFEKLMEVSNGRVWAAKPDDVIDYIYMRRNTGIVGSGEGDGVFWFETRHKITIGLMRHLLCFRVHGAGKLKDPKVELSIAKEKTKEHGHCPTAVEKVERDGDDLLITCTAWDGQRVGISEAKRPG